MKKWNLIRLNLLRGVAGGILLTVGFIYFNPPSLLKLPEEISLSKWQLTETQDLEIDNKTYVAKKYQYQLGLNQVIVKLKYLKDGQGDNIKLLQASKSIDLSNSDVEILDIAGVGYTGVFTHQGTAYLSSCLNPQGGATFTAEQFAKNRNTLDVQFNRVLPWIFGLHDLRDWRCLWVTFSTPVHSDNPQQTYALLKQVWQEWYVESDWEEVF